MVNELEERIRDALRADAAAVRPESIPGVPPRPLRPLRPPRRGSRRTTGPWPARGRALVPLAAAAAVAATVVGLTVARPLPGSGRRPASGTAVASPSPGHRLAIPTISPQPAHLGPAPKPVLGPTASRGVPAATAPPGVPRYYVTIYAAPAVNSAPWDSMIVRDTATGKVVGRLNPPGNTVFAGLAATAGGRTFVTAISPGNSCATSALYQFRLNAQGQPGPLVSLHVTVPGNIAQGLSDLAITPDGHTIAYATNGCDGTAKTVGVINLATRHVRAWNASGGRGSPLDQIQSLSLSASGGLLGFESPPAADGADGLRILDTGAPAGSVFARSRAVSATTFWGALASAGASLYGCTLSPYHGILPDVGTLTYYELPLAGGRQQVIGRWASVKCPQCDASLDPAGNYLLVQFPAVAHGVNEWSRAAVLDLHTGRLTSIDAPAFYGPFDIAW